LLQTVFQTVIIRCDRSRRCEFAFPNAPGFLPPAATRLIQHHLLVQSRSQPLPRLGSRVRIPSPAPILLKKISCIEGSCAGRLHRLCVGVHMVSTAADGDTTRRLQLASVEAPSCKPGFEWINWPALRCANRRLDRRPTGSTATSLARRNARWRNSSWS
jgi:hypothetical protein